MERRNLQPSHDIADVPEPTGDVYNGSRDEKAGAASGRIALRKIR